MRYIDLQKPEDGGLQEMIRFPHFLRGWQSLIHLAHPPLPFLQYRVPHIHGIAKKFDVMQDFDGKEEVSQKDDCKQAIAAEGST